MAEIKFQEIKTNHEKGITAYYLPNDEASKQESPHDDSNILKHL